VASQWSVNDGATALLMEEFYTNLWQKKLTKLEALRQAQLHLLRHPELMDRMEGILKKKLNNRGLSSRGDHLASGLTALAGRSAPGTGGPLTAARGAAAPTPGELWRGPGSRLPQPVAGPANPRRTPPAYWAAFVLSGASR